MTQRIGGNAGLPYPQNLYPSQLQNTAPDCPTNRVALAPGDTLPIPAGDWFVNCGQYCFLQFLDPVTGLWSMGPNAAWNGGHQFVVSDGFNVRVANLTGCPLSASVTNYGAGGYVQSTTTITPTPGNSTWLPIVGGQLTVGSFISRGAGYGVAPEVFLPAPPPASNNANGVGGLPASAYAVISSGTVSTISFTNPGAGYPSTFTAVLVPSPTDPNLSAGITNATVLFSLAGSGSITGAICTNPGAPLSNPNQFTLTVTGAGTQATVVGNVLQTVTAATVSTVGAGYGTTAALLTTVGGVPAAGTVTNNQDALGLAWRPRPAQIGFTVAGATGSIGLQSGTIYDGGLFLTNAAPAFVVGQNANTGSVTVATIALTMGSRADVVTIQPAP